MTNFYSQFFIVVCTDVQCICSNVLSLNNERHILRFVLKSKLFVRVFIIFKIKSSQSNWNSYMYDAPRSMHAAPFSHSFRVHSEWPHWPTLRPTSTWPGGLPGATKNSYRPELISRSYIHPARKSYLQYYTIMSYFIIHKGDKVTFLRDQLTWNELGCDCFRVQHQRYWLCYNKTRHLEQNEH